MHKQFRKLAGGIYAAFLPFLVYGQTAISGVINHYTTVTAIDYCQNSATVSGTANFSPGTTVLLIQMKGATINTSNSAAFGDIADLGDAGRYEKAVIASLAGNTVFFENALLHTYNTGGSVQLVDVPFYENALVTGTLSAAPWNGQTGGVLALEVSGTLTLQADLDVSGKGFRGGIADITATNNCNWLISINGYAYGPNDWRGAAKGEGVAAFVASQETGRGAQANGGGGGNDHNSGGGGGANINAGGKGGNNDEPSFFGCDGFFPGRGGKAISTNSVRCFFGGGGGAGHENNGVGTDGGNGGGILLLKSGVIVANGFALRANGQNAESTFGEGAGGGGGGGTILLDVSSANGALLLEARGGNGGNIDNFGLDRCSGPGGGGSGGRLLYTASVSPVNNVSGGAAGISSNSSSCATGSNDAQAGSAGTTGAFTGIPQGLEPNLPPQIAAASEMAPVCAGDLLTIPLSVQGFGLSYRWQLNTGSGFTDIQDGSLYAGTGSSDLEISGVTESMNGYIFRLKVSSNCFPTVFSDEIALEVVPAPQAVFSYTVSGLMASFSNGSSSASAFWWDFGDNGNSSGLNPQHTYAVGGEYTVTLLAINACDTAYTTMLVEVFLAPEAAFVAENTEGCAPRTVVFANQSTGNYNSLLWLFPGGAPTFSNEENPLVTYAQPGEYDVTLIVIGALVNDTLTLPALVSVLPEPIADFNFQITGNQVIFTNLSSNATAFNWDFGDNSISTESNPQHTYALTGVYSVTLNAQNAYCGHAVSQSLLIGANGVAETASGNEVSIFPNPAAHEFFIKTNDNQAIIEATLLTLNGVKLMQQKQAPGMPFRIGQFPSGNYLLQVKQGKLKRTISLIKH